MAQRDTLCDACERPFKEVGNGKRYDVLCQDCYEQNEIDSHLGGYHKDEPSKLCPCCQDEALGIVVQEVNVG